MSNLGQGGWISRVMSLQHEAIATAADAYTQKKVRKAESKRAKAERQFRASLSEKERAFRDQELATKMAVSKRRDILFKQIAIYSIISISVIAVLITGGVFLIKSGKKREAA